MDSHGVEIFDGANDDALVLPVPHDLHLVFLPAEQALFDEHLMYGGNLQSMGDDLLILRHLLTRSSLCLSAISRQSSHLDVAAARSAVAYSGPPRSSKAAGGAEDDLFDEVAALSKRQESCAARLGTVAWDFLKNLQV